MARRPSPSNRTSKRRRQKAGSKRKGPGEAGPLTNNFLFTSLRKLGDLMREARNLPARVVLVNDVALRCLHQFWFCAHHRLQRCGAVAALDRFLDGADRAAQLGPARLVDDGAAGNLAGRLLGGSRIGHLLKSPSAVTDRGWPGSARPSRSIS